MVTANHIYFVFLTWPFQRTSAPFRPIALISFAVRFFARAFPPRRPSDTAARFFLVMGGIVLTGKHSAHTFISHRRRIFPLVGIERHQHMRVNF